jgi:ERCC4-type nuclease
VIVDTREKVNSHITDWFDKQKIPWISKALQNGDYSVMIPANSELNIERDLLFDKEIMIERKNSLDEIGSNFTTYRSRFEEEMATFAGKKYLLIENAHYGDIIAKNYRNKLSSKAFIGSIHAFNHRYGIEIMFMPDNSYSAPWIYGSFLYYIKDILR